MQQQSRKSTNSVGHNSLTERQWCIYTSMILNPIMLCKQNTNLINMAYVSLWTILQPKLSENYIKQSSQFWSKQGKQNINICTKNHKHCTITKQPEQTNTQQAEAYQEPQQQPDPLSKILQIPDPQSYLNQKQQRIKKKYEYEKCLKYIYLINSYLDLLDNPIKYKKIKKFVTHCYYFVKNNSSSFCKQLVYQNKKINEQNDNKHDHDHDADDDDVEQKTQKSFTYHKASIQYLSWHGYVKSQFICSMFDRKYKQYQLQMKINQITKQDKIQQMNQSLQFDMDSQSVIIPYFFVTDAVYQGCEDTFGDLPPPNHIFSGYHHLCRLHIKIYSQYQKQNQLKQYIQCQQKCTQSYALSKNPKYIFNPMSVFQIKKLKKYQKQGDIFEMCLSFQNSIPISTFSPPAQIKNLDKQILDKYQQNLLKMGVGYRQDILNNGDVYCMLGRFYSYDYYFQAEKYFREQLARQQKSKIKINSNFFYYMKLCCIANQIHSTIKIIQYGRQLQKFINQKQFLGLAYVYIGVSRYHEKKYQQAIQFYEKAKNYQNNYQKNGRRIIMSKDLLVTVHNNLAMAHFALENLKESEQQFQQALRIAKKQFGQHSINYLTVEINRIKAQFTDGPDAKDLYEDIQFECSGLGAIDAYTGCHYEVAYLLLKTLEYNIDIPLQNLLQNFNGQLKKQSTEKILNQQRIRKLQKVRSLQKKIYGRISLQLAKTMLKLSKCYPIKIDKKSNAGKEQKSPLSTFGQDYLNASLEIVLQLLKNQKEVRVDEMYLLLEDIGNAYKKYFLIQDALEVYKICQEAYTKNNSNRLKQVQSIIHELNRKLAWSNKQ